MDAKGEPIATSARKQRERLGFIDHAPLNNLFTINIAFLLKNVKYISEI